jgi:DNA-directed RNA polymerase specialized sigma24 family protein
VAEHSREADFVDLHGDRLFGFAVLVTLGDTELAGTLAAEALRDGIDRLDQLRHPVRAAAWLRARVRKAAGRPAWGHKRPSETERRDALRPLGVDAPTYDALASLDARGRAAVVATTVEGFAPADVHEIVGSDERVRAARRAYLTAYLAASQARDTPPPDGELAARVRAAAAPVLSGRS